MLISMRTPYDVLDLKVLIVIMQFMNIRNNQLMLIKVLRITNEFYQLNYL